MSFEELYEKYFRLVYALAHERLKDMSMEEDVVQEVFLKLSRQMQMCPFYNESHVKGWLLRTTSNLCIDLLRKRSVENQYRGQLQKQMSSMEMDQSMERVHEQLEIQEQLGNTLCKLRKKNKKWYIVIMEYYCNQKSTKELAEQFHISNAGMCMQLLRIRRWIGKDLLEQNAELRQIYDKAYTHTEGQKKEEQS